jgi:hypothetical protein
MAAIDIGPLEEWLDIGARVHGVRLDRLADGDRRSRLTDLFEQAGVIIYGCRGISINVTTTSSIGAVSCARSRFQAKAA